MKHTSDQESLRRANDSRALDTIRKGKLTRRQLQKVISLSWGGVTNTVNRLMHAGYIIETPSESAHSSGRTPGILEINPSDNCVLGVDVNDTGLTGCIMNLSGDILAEYSAAADYSSPSRLMDALISFIGDILTEHTRLRMLAMGISMQGEVDPVEGVSLILPQCPGWENVPLKKILTEKFGLDAHVAHDPDCMLHAYMAEHAGRNIVLMRLDKSAGLAVAIEGRILMGSGILEVAHMTVDPSGPACSCGARGCLDAYIAANQRTPGALSAPLDTALRNISRLFRPDTIVLCGDLMRREIKINMENIVVISDARAAMRGAALIAIDEAIQNLDIREENQSGGDHT